MGKENSGEPDMSQIDQKELAGDIDKLLSLREVFIRHTPDQELIYQTLKKIKKLNTPETIVDIFCNKCLGLIKIEPVIKRAYTPETMGQLIHNKAYCPACQVKMKGENK